MRCLTTLLFLLVFSTTPFCSSVASAQPFSEIVAFGASLTDAGNITELSRTLLGQIALPSPPYFEHRSSNGPNWVDVLADQLGLSRAVASKLGGKNYAYGAATSGTIDNEFLVFGLLDMDDQVAEYLSMHSPTGDELFVIPGWISTSDFANGQDDPTTAVAMVGSLVSDLASAGAKNVLVGNSIDSPRFSFPELLRAFNDELAVEMAVQRAAFPQVNFFEFDAESAFDAILSDPASLGLTNLTDSACRDCGAGRNPFPIDIVDNPNQFLFWDGVSHFTAPVHEALGIAASRAVPEPTAFVLWATVLPCAIMMRRTRRL